MYFWLQVQIFLVLDETLDVNKFEDADFKYGISFLKFQPKILNNGNFCPKFQDFLGGRNCVFGKI